MTRLFLTSLMMFVWIGSAFPQAAGKNYVIGILTSGHDEAMIGPREFTLPELAHLGFIEGQNFRVEWRFPGGVAERLPALAKELVEARVDLIIGVSTIAIRAAKSATNQIPIVMAFAGDDPVAEGVIQSLARPGGNVTGLALLAAEGDLKRIELLREAMPDAKRFAYLVSPVRRHVLNPAERYATEAGFHLDIMSAATRADYNSVFEGLERERPAALAIGSFPTFFNDIRELTARTRGMKIPTMCQWPEMANLGCTVAFGPPVGPLFKRVGWYVAQVLNGRSPADLPVEQPDRFHLVLNLRAARELGVTFSNNVLARADEVIE
jgi:putative tryptophan/tyrosine transport system substrate-binding protein